MRESRESGVWGVTGCVLARRPIVVELDPRGRVVICNCECECGCGGKWLCGTSSDGSKVYARGGECGADRTNVAGMLCSRRRTARW